VDEVRTRETREKRGGKISCTMNWGHILSHAYVLTRKGHRLNPHPKKIRGGGQGAADKTEAQGAFLRKNWKGKGSKKER